MVEYAFKALDALGVKFGPTHTGLSDFVCAHARRVWQTRVGALERPA